jgi:hypothetical protein
MFKKSLLSAALALTLSAWAAPASAVSVVFDPSGTAGTAGNIVIDALDPTVGNAIALGATIANTPGQQLTVLFQANLAVASNLGVVRFGNGLPYVDVNGAAQVGPYYVTIVAGFTETVQAPMGGATVQSVLNPAGQVNFFNIYVNSVAPGDNLSGVCFVCGTLALQGTFVLDPRVSNVSDFTLTGGLNNAAPLDGFNGDDYSTLNGGLGVHTLQGQGSFNTAVQVSSVNSLYFPTLTPNTVLTMILASSQELLNYQTGDPSACFSNNGTTSCNQQGVSTVGLVNLLSGPNSMFQTDASFAFQGAPVVPEPATLTLLGLGVLAGARRARKNKK